MKPKLKRKARARKSAKPLEQGERAEPNMVTVRLTDQTGNSKSAVGLAGLLVVLLCVAALAHLAPNLRFTDAGAGISLAAALKRGDPPGPPDGSRAVAVRLFQGGAFVLPGEKWKSVATTLARLRPTWVTAPLRYRAGDTVSSREVRAWNTIRGAVLEASPEAKFTVMLNAAQYQTTDRLRVMMGRLRRVLRPDAWAFDFYTRAARRNMKVMKAAIADAHTHGELIGGSVFGIATKPVIPPGTDFVIVQGVNFRIKLDAVSRLARRFPVFLQIGSSPKYARSDGCRFIREFSTHDRSAYITRRARQQAKYGFRFTYPVFFPLCNKRLHAPDQKLFAYNASKDPVMLRTVEQLMDEYEAVPSG